MNIAIVTINQENAAIAAGWRRRISAVVPWRTGRLNLACSGGTGAGCVGGTVAANASDVVLFPPGTFGDELSTRLAGVYMVQASAR